jgi:prolyl-tRNA synthetase
MDLIGIPHRVVIGERGMKSGQYEYKGRSEEKPTAVASAEIVSYLRERVSTAQ